MSSTYQPPTYSHVAASGTGPGMVIDTGTADSTCGQPVLHLKITGSATVLVEGSHDPAGASGWFDYSGGGFTSDQSKRFTPGVRFWRTNITANSGVVTSSVGIIISSRGGVHAVNNVIVTNNAPL
jgi:hypothetical protein